MKQASVKRLVGCGLIAAVYVVLSVALAPVSFGGLQFRVSEALTLLPVFSPYAIIGVTLGCFLSNVAGAVMGLTPPLDILFGTAATLLAALCTWALRSIRFRTIPLAAAVPPIVLNAVIIGWEIAFFFLPGTAFWPGFWASALGVGAGQTAACGILGLLLVAALERTGADRLLREL